MHSIRRQRRYDRAVNTLDRGMEMHGMAVQTKRRLVLLEQIVGHRTVRRMTKHTIFDRRSMLENERPFFVGMTGEA